MARQTSVQITEQSDRQVETLKVLGYGTFTDIVRIAIDRMYRDELSFLGDLLPEVIVTNIEIVHRDVNIITAQGTITQGYSLAVTLRYNGDETIVDTLNLLVTGEQSSDWCIHQCERLEAELSQTAIYTPGQIRKLLLCGYQPLADLKIPVPPQQPYSSSVESYDGLYQEWVKDYNSWIKAHPELAADYGCAFMES